MRRPIALPAAFFLAAAAAISAQQAQPPTFRSRTELIIVDAVVVDQDGNAVRGLKASDFALTDRKKPQRIETFEEVTHERPDRANPAVAGLSMLPLTLKRDVASNTTVQADRLIMVVIDDLHIWKGRTEKAKALARDIVTRLGDEASMAIVFTSREGGTEVTQDRSGLLAAIDRMTARQTFRRPHHGWLYPGVGFIDPGASSDARLDKLNTAAKVSLQDINDNEQYVQTLKDAANLLIHEDRRRKAFVVISEGIGTDLSFLQGGGSAQATIVGEPELATTVAGSGWAAVMNALRKANAALYAIDPRGKVRAEDMMLESWPPPDCAACMNPPGPDPGPTGTTSIAPMRDQPRERVTSREDSQFAWENPVRMAQSGLGFQAEAFGGFAVTDTDDLTGGLNKILEDLDHYYLLGFYPTDTSSKEAHPVGLTVVGHPEYTIRFRRGYTPDSPSAATKEARNKDPLVELASGVMPKSDLPLRLTAMPLPGAFLGPEGRLGKEVSVVVALEVTAPVNLMKEADKKLRDDVTYSVMVVDGKKAKVAQRTGRSASFSMSVKDPSKPEPDQVTYQIPLTIDLVPGRYQLRASAMSKKLNKGGSVYIDVTVPEFSKSPLALSAIAIGFADGARVPVGRTTTRTVSYGMPGRFTPPDQVVPLAQEQARNNRNPLPFEPTLSREFDRSDVLATYFEVARKDTSSTVALEIRLLDSNNEPQLRFDRILSPRDRGTINLRIPLEKLAPGAYVLRVTAGDSSNKATTETGFIVR
jgi:VWFA-related protein